MGRIGGDYTGSTIPRVLPSVVGGVQGTGPLPGPGRGAAAAGWPTAACYAAPLPRAGGWPGPRPRCCQSGSASSGSAS